VFFFACGVLKRWHSVRRRSNAPGDWEGGLLSNFHYLLFLPSLLNLLGYGEHHLMTKQAAWDGAAIILCLSCVTTRLVEDTMWNILVP